MSNNAINVRPTFRDKLGRVRANGWLFFYNNNTTTLATIYSDEALTVPQSNPYQLDAYGRISGDVKYKATLTIKATNEDGSMPTTDDDIKSSFGDVTTIEQFKAEQSNPIGMTVTLIAGRVMNGETLVVKGAQQTTAFIAPTVNPRIDRIVINKLTGIYSVVAGVEAGSPPAPAIPVNTSPVCQIFFAVGTSSIIESMITDERISASIEPSNVNSTETLANKTLTSPVISTISNTGIITLPTSTDTLVAKNTTDTLTNKTIVAANNTITTATSGTLTATELNAALAQLEAAVSIESVGTWTPTLSDATTAVSKGQTYASQLGEYYQIGKLTIISFKLQVLSIGSLSGNVHILGNPFYIRGNAYGEASAGGVSITAGYNITLQAFQQYLDFNYWNTTSGDTKLQFTNVPALTTIKGSIVYQQN